MNIGSIVLEAMPCRESDSLAAVLSRFETDADCIAVPVVNHGGQVTAIFERERFLLTGGGRYGFSLIRNRTVGQFLAHRRVPLPMQVDVDAPLMDVADVLLRPEATAGKRILGWASKEGRYAGLVTQDHLSKALLRMARVQADALATALVAAQRATELKTAFLSNMSHEIRTPMTAILGFVELLMETDLSEDQREWAATVDSAGRSLLTLINDILDISRIESGRFVLQRELFSPMECLVGVRDLFLVQAREKGISLNLSIGPLPDHVYGDALRVRQILTNLVGNAVKFTEAGSVSIVAGPGRACPSGVSIDVEVADTGPGIPPESIDAIWSPFVQGDPGLTRRHGGSGLGLSIVRALTDLMGGTVALESRVGIGSRFTVSLPLQQYHRMPCPDSGCPADPPGEGGTRCLFEGRVTGGQPGHDAAGAVARGPATRSDATFGGDRV